MQVCVLQLVYYMLLFTNYSAIIDTLLCYLYKNGSLEYLVFLNGYSKSNILYYFCYPWVLLSTVPPSHDTPLSQDGS
jgi:hypothetical protein